MRIAVTGALGGIGRSLVSTLANTHDVVGIVRAASGAVPAGIPLVALDQLDDLGDIDCVIHCALDSKAPRGQFLSANQALDERVLRLALAGSCRLFVYFSSWVVYSGIDPAAGDGYRETQQPESRRGLDAYTRLKIEAERRVVAACEAAGVSWLIVRPAIVCGPGLGWSDGVVRLAARWGLPALRGKMMNCIRADDLSLMVARLIERGTTNDIVNLGGSDIASEDYFAEVGKLAGRRPMHLPDGLMRLAKPALPSTFWFLAARRTVDLEKLERLAGPVPKRSVGELFNRWAGMRHGVTLDDLKAAARSHYDFRAHAHNYGAWFGQTDPHGTLSLGTYRGIVSTGEETVTVKAGTRLDEISLHLAETGRALATLPEFLGISAGACFFVDVHGSSGEFFSLFDLIEEIKYIDEAGEEVVSARDPQLWSVLRRKRQRFILTEMTFATVPAPLLSNHIKWGDYSQILAYVDGRWRDNLSTTLQWYPHQRRFFAYNIRPATPEEAQGAGRSFAPFRGLPYNMQRALLATQPPKLVDRWHNILGPWRRVIFENWTFRTSVRGGRQVWWDMEMLFTLEDGRRMLEELRDRILAGEIAYGRSAGIGIRFSHDRRTGLDYLWIETQGTGEHLSRIARIACDTAKDGVRFHAGKTVPAIAGVLDPKDPAPLWDSPPGSAPGAFHAGLPA